ncbi:MAG: glycerate kinase type-2 family protein [Burkholderiales bacterium]
MRHVARQIFADALAQASVASAFEQHVQYEHGVMRVRDDLYNLDSFSRVLAVALGKAAHTMAEALVKQLGSRVAGFVASSVNPPQRLAQFIYFHGGHPLPNEESVRAATAVQSVLETLDESSLVIYLLSGGGSAILERPIFGQISLDDLIATYDALVYCGATIAEINAVRKHLSAVKGGRLAQAAYPAHQVSIMVSDVPDDQLDSLASGPTMPDSSTVSDCYEIVTRYKLLPKFPPAVRVVFEQKLLQETPKSDEPAFVRSRWWPILSSGMAAKEAAALAASGGFAVEIDNTCDNWDYQRAADYLLRRVRKLREGASKVCVISAGEVTVNVDRTPGIGGRNQHFALYCAEKIRNENVTVLSAGTDGIDGNSEAAGAVTDGTTLERAGASCVNHALKTFNAFPLLQQLNDTILTGPTGNNVRDLRILLAY